MPGTKHELNKYEFSYYRISHLLPFLIRQMPVATFGAWLCGHSSVKRSRRPQKASPPLCSWNLLTYPSPHCWSGCSSLCLPLHSLHRRHPITIQRCELLDFMGATSTFRIICLGHLKVLISLLSIIFSNSRISTVPTRLLLKGWTVSFTGFSGLLLPPLPVSLHPNLNVNRVCYQCFPDSSLPLQLGFLFTCRD